MNNKTEDAIDAFMAALITACCIVLVLLVVWLIVLLPLVLLPMVGFASIWWAWYTYYQS